MYTSRYSWLYIVGFILLLCCVVGGYWLVLQKQRLDQLVCLLQERDTSLRLDPQDKNQVQTMVIAQQDMWRAVQEKAKNTVVQVFAQVAEINMLLPFKMPNHYTRFGSAFFIESQHDQGYLITNAHVVNQATEI